MAASLGSVGSSVGSPAPSPVNNNAGNAPVDLNAQGVAQQALANNQQPVPPQGQNPAQSFNDIGDQVNNQGEGDAPDPNQPSPFMMIASMVAKYALPALLVIGGFVAVGASLCVAGATASIATPFLLLAGGAVFVTIGMGYSLAVWASDFSRDMYIRELQMALQKEKDKKNASVSAADALKKEAKELEEKIKNKKSRNDELIRLRNAGTQLNDDKLVEMERLDREMKELAIKLQKNKQCLQLLETPERNPAAPVAV